jgi:hypothetical protein
MQSTVNLGEDTYGLAEEGPELDQRATECVRRQEDGRDGAEWGRSFLPRIEVVHQSP